MNIKDLFERDSDQENEETLVEFVRVGDLVSDLARSSQSNIEDILRMHDIRSPQEYLNYSITPGDTAFAIFYGGSVGTKILRGAGDDGITGLKRKLVYTTNRRDRVFFKLSGGGKDKEDYEGREVFELTREQTKLGRQIIKQIKRERNGSDTRKATLAVAQMAEEGKLSYIT